jgi:hypothetical protein
LRLLNLAQQKKLGPSISIESGASNKENRNVSAIIAEEAKCVTVGNTTAPDQQKPFFN